MPRHRRERWGIARKVNDEGLYTIYQAAKMIGRSADSIRRWVRKGTIPHPRTMTFGDVEVWVFGLEDIAKLKEVRDNIQWGRPPAAGLKPLARDPKTKRLTGPQKES